MRTAFRLVAPVALAAALSGCGKPMAWNGPGWYLEMPHVIAFGSDFYGGPMSYDECEAKRLQEAVATRMLCTRYVANPAEAK
jgi:hypothetical protein